MGSFASTSSGHVSKMPSVQKAEDQENNVQTSGFSDPKINKAEESSLGKMHSTVQAKLKIGSPGDKFEKEADETAEKVMTMPDVQKVYAGGDEPPVQKKANEEEDAPAVSKKENEEVQPKVEENTISKKSFLQTALYDDHEDVRNDFINAKEDDAATVSKKEDGMLNAKFSFPKVPEIAAPKAPQAPKGGKKAAAKAGGKAGKAGKKDKAADPLKVPVEIPQLKKEKKPAAKKKLKVQKKEADETISKKSFLQTLPADEKVQQKEEENTLSKKSFLQTLSDDVQSKGASSDQAGEGFESTLKSTKGGGSSMSEETQADMSGRFGRDFSNVRIHTNSTAADMNKEIGAKAFTNENDIYFNSGQYNEKTDEGKSLLAHELTHTIQQGASGDNVQAFMPEPRTTTKEPLPEPVNDGDVVKSESKEYYENHEDFDEDAPTSVGEMDDEDKEKANDRDGDPEEKTKIEDAGVTKPDEDRSQTAAEKTKQQKEAIANKNKQEQQVTPPDKKDDKKEPQPKVSEKDLAKQKADQAHQDALKIKEPPRLKKVKQPRMETPVDAEGEKLPSDSQLNSTVDGLASMAEMFRDHGREIRFYAAAQQKRSFATDEFVFKQKGDLANNKEVTEKAQDQNQQRVEISAISKPALKDSQERQSFVETEAPKLNTEAKSGESDAGQLVDETKNQAEENKSNLSDDPDARADSEAQGEEMESGAEGSATIFDAIVETIKATAQYMLDADVAKKDNEASQKEIAENDTQIGLAAQRITELQAGNAKTEEQIANMEFGPDEMRERAASLDDNGDEIIQASMVMEDELIDIQQKYYEGMATVPGEEEARKKIKEEQEKEQELSPDQMEVMMLAGMGETEQQDYVDTLPETKKDTLLAALESMVSYVDDKGTDASEGRRKKLDTGLGKHLETHAEDPRMMFAQPHEDERKNRLQMPLDIADRNMGVISEAQKAELADRLATDAYTEQMKGMVSWQMAGDMAQGMIDPRMALGGMVSGFEKMGSGLLNIVNWEAWEKDPLGNLLQIGADLSTGVARIAGGILSLGMVIQTLMVFINVITWGFGIPFTMPEMIWMGTVMSVSGWVAVIAGALSVLFNSLAYTKNLHDAATAPTAREFFGNVEQMKENAADGTEGLMSVIGGKGSIKMSKGFNMRNMIKPLPPGGFKGLLQKGLKGSKNLGSKMTASIGKGFTSLFQGGLKAFKSFGEKIKNLFKKKKNKNKDMTPEEINKNSVAEHKSTDGHTRKVMEDGQVATCSHCSMTRNTYDAELKKNPGLNDELTKLEKKLDADPNNPDLIRQHEKIENQLERSKTASTKSDVTKLDFENMHELKVCFPSGTPVHTKDGMKNIEDIKINEEVYTYNILTGSVELNTVIQLFKTSTDLLVNIDLGGEVIQVTAKHPFWIEDDQSWKPAAFLKSGMTLKKLKTGSVVIKQISTVRSECDTYNIGVKENHNYYVGNSGVLVHNKISPNSSYLKTDKVAMDFYEIFDINTGEVVYVGQTESNVGYRDRYKQHIAEGKKKGNWKKMLSSGNYQVRQIKNPPKPGQPMTKFQANLTEQKFIDERGGKSRLKNKINAIGESKFADLKQLAKDNPELFKKIYDPTVC